MRAMSATFLFLFWYCPVTSGLWWSTDAVPPTHAIALNITITEESTLETEQLADLKRQDECVALQSLLEDMWPANAEAMIGCIKTPNTNSVHNITTLTVFFNVDGFDLAATPSIRCLQSIADDLERNFNLLEKDVSVTAWPTVLRIAVYEMNVYLKNIDLNFENSSKEEAAIKVEQDLKFQWNPILVDGPTLIGLHVKSFFSGLFGYYKVAKIKVYFDAHACFHTNDYAAAFICNNTAENGQQITKAAPFENVTYADSIWGIETPSSSDLVKGSFIYDDEVCSAEKPKVAYSTLQTPNKTSTVIAFNITIQSADAAEVTEWEQFKANKSESDECTIFSELLRIKNPPYDAAQIGCLRVPKPKAQNILSKFTLFFDVNRFPPSSSDSTNCVQRFGSELRSSLTLRSNNLFVTPDPSVSRVAIYSLECYAGNIDGDDQTQDESLRNRELKHDMRINWIPNVFKNLNIIGFHVEEFGDDWTGLITVGIKLYVNVGECLKAKNYSDSGSCEVGFQKRHRRTTMPVVQKKAYIKTIDKISIVSTDLEDTKNFQFATHTCRTWIWNNGSCITFDGPPKGFPGDLFFYADGDRRRLTTAIQTGMKPILGSTLHNPKTGNSLWTSSYGTRYDRKPKRHVIWHFCYDHADVSTIEYLRLEFKKNLYGFSESANATATIRRCLVSEKPFKQISVHLHGEVDVRKTGLVDKDGNISREKVESMVLNSLDSTLSKWNTSGVVALRVERINANGSHYLNVSSTILFDKIKFMKEVISKTGECTFKDLYAEAQKLFTGPSENSFYNYRLQDVMELEAKAICGKIKVIDYSSTDLPAEPDIPAKEVQRRSANKKRKRMVFVGPKSTTVQTEPAQIATMRIAERSGATRSAEWMFCLSFTMVLTELINHLAA